MKAQPLAYNKDNQEDKEPLFDTIDNLKGCLRVYADMVPKMTIKRDSMRAAAARGYSTATDFADYLVRDPSAAHPHSSRLTERPVSLRKARSRKIGWLVSYFDQYRAVKSAAAEQPNNIVQSKQASKDSDSLRCDQSLLLSAAAWTNAFQVPASLSSFRVPLPRRLLSECQSLGQLTVCQCPWRSPSSTCVEPLVGVDE